VKNQFTLLDYASNPIVWVILLLAITCYVLQMNLILAQRNQSWQQQVRVWNKVLPILLSALPLLGLLGTIAGLLSTFAAMSRSSGLDQQALLSGGVADALITTQLGLVTAIPGLLLMAWIKYLYRESGGL
jgi:biopolymer transport protein ExbB